MHNLVTVAFLGLLLSACSSSPTSPSTAPAAFRFPPEMAPVIRQLDNDPWMHPLLGQSLGTYVRTHVKEIRFDATIKPPVLAYAYTDGIIGWQAYDPLPTYDTHDVALSVGYVLHEARHIQGYRHTCGDDTHDRTFEEGGAWAVHITYLEHAGFPIQADAIRKAFIGCR